MRHLSFDELDAERNAFDELVTKTPDIDLFCSSTMWILPAREAFGPTYTSQVYRCDSGYIALAQTTLPDENGKTIRLLQPLELSWGFPCALIGEDAHALGRELAGLLLRSHDWDLVALAGIVPDSPSFEGVLDALGRNFKLYRGESTRRFRAVLDGGFDGFLAKRSRDFRKNVRRGRVKAENAGIAFVQAPAAPTPVEADALYDRILAVDDRSWKGREGVGLNASAMAVHYRGMTKRMAERGVLRLWFAQQGGRDIGYVLGGVFAGTYRGLQFAYDDDFSEYGLGNLAQLITIETVAGEGIGIYDLGSDVPYKAKWGEEVFETSTILVAR